MLDVLPGFEWSKCRQRHRIIDGQIEPAGPDFDRYRPFEVNALFAHFADASTDAKLLLFCDKFGLPVGQLIQQLVARNRFLGRIHRTNLKELRRHQANMQRAVKAFESDDLSEIMNICNVTESIVSMRIQLRRDAAGKLGMFFEPPHLLGAMWLQFATLVCSGGSLCRCQRCGAPIAVGTGTGRRTTAMYCTNACKVATHKPKIKARRRLAHLASVALRKNPR